MPPHLTAAQKQLAFRLNRRGLSLRQIGREVGCSGMGVSVVLRDRQRVVARRDRWLPGPARLQLRDREEISLGLMAGQSRTQIARHIARATSTVCREIAANGGRADYRAWRAHQHAYASARRPKPYRLAAGMLCDRVSDGLRQFWSPEQVSKRLRQDFPDDPLMRVSHETIYQSLFVQGRGELRRELARVLRSGQTRRRSRDTTKPSGQLPDMVTIAERPAEVEDRAVPGHWEGDLLCGAFNRSAVGTLVERSSRYVMLLHLPEGHEAVQVERAMKQAIRRMPPSLFKTLTWDRGKEMARHKEIKVATGVQVYFCDPHAPWQRGSNENTNRLLRQFLPSGTDLTAHTSERLEHIAQLLNDRPRKTLGFMTPSERLAELVAMTR
jgi:IS30 family transposase